VERRIQERSCSVKVLHPNSIIRNPQEKEEKEEEEEKRKREGMRNITHPPTRKDKHPSQLNA
jgi:hypothetical protein